MNEKAGNDGELSHDLLERIRNALDAGSTKREGVAQAQPPVVHADAWAPSTADTLGIADTLARLVQPTADPGRKAEPPSTSDPSNADRGPLDHRTG